MWVVKNKKSQSQVLVETKGRRQKKTSYPKGGGGAWETAGFSLWKGSKKKKRDGIFQIWLAGVDLRRPFSKKKNICAQNALNYQKSHFKAT